MLSRSMTTPAVLIRRGAYCVRLIQSPAEYDQALRLRFRVFNQELGAALPTAADGRDEDRFDATCDHLVVLNETTNMVVGTYRLQTIEQALRGEGLYTATEFDLRNLPSPLLLEGVELGRACIAQSDRTPYVLLLLWQGIAAYARANGKRYLFGCCSVNSRAAGLGWAIWADLQARGQAHPQIRVDPLPGFACPQLDGAVERLELPRLFRTYLRYGALVCSPPALDREFGTLDFMTLLDLAALDAQAQSLFLGA